MSKESDVMIELEENSKKLETLGIKVQNLGDSL